MKKTKLKIIFIVFLICISGWLSYKVAYRIGEKYFFDKLFFQKSLKHGYWVSDKITNNDFGKRAKDLVSLEGLKHDDKVKGILDVDKYTIVIIGDSYVWGQGIKEEQRFAELLEKKLNKIRPTKVMSLGRCADSILDYLARYEKVKDNYNVDLYIFTTVFNDALLNKDSRLENNDYKNIISNCIKQNDIYPVYELNPPDGGKWFSNFIQVRINPTNMCVMEKSIEQLPTEKSIYFITEDYWGDNEDFKYYRNFLNKYNKYIVSSDRGSKLKKYIHCWSSTDFWKDCGRVSPNEGHPSVLMNQMYADVLYQEIIDNTKWNFK